ncbi:MAG: hypothetical protein H8D34_32880 [Chloroflexi bacterium]|nr:hypothetical protein [Chloroflexota bacterium]
MFQTTRIVNLAKDCETVIAQIGRHLGAIGMRIERSFDLQSACASNPDLTCPHHRDVPCDCQLVVLLVYDENGTPSSLVVRSHMGQTEINLVDSPNPKLGQELADLIHRILVPENKHNELL